MLFSNLNLFSVFNVEWIKINAKWKYPHTLLYAISNCFIAYVLYDKEDEIIVEKFLRESTTNKNKKQVP